jgi:hypothetical protein
MNMWHANNKRINDSGNAVFDILRHDPRVGDTLIATVEVRSDAPGCLKVLLGAMQRKGKRRAWDAIRAYQSSQGGEAVSPPSSSTGVISSVRP